MQQIYRRTPMSKCEFNKLHFGMSVLLCIKFAPCIFSEHIFIRTPLDGCFWYEGYLAHFLVAFEKESIFMLWKLNEAKNFHNNFHDMLEMGLGVEIKCHITFFWEQIKVRVVPKKEVEKPCILVFDLGISTNKGRVSTLLGKLGKVREFVRGSGKVRKI